MSKIQQVLSDVRAVTADKLPATLLLRCYACSRQPPHPPTCRCKKCPIPAGDGALWRSALIGLDYMGVTTSDASRVWRWCCMDCFANPTKVPNTFPAGTWVYVAHDQPRVSFSPLAKADAGAFQVAMQINQMVHLARLSSQGFPMAMGSHPGYNRRDRNVAWLNRHAVVLPEVGGCLRDQATGQRLRVIARDGRFFHLELVSQVPGCADRVLVPVAQLVGPYGTITDDRSPNDWLAWRAAELARCSSPKAGA